MSDSEAIPAAPKRKPRRFLRWRTLGAVVLLLVLIAELLGDTTAPLVEMKDGNDSYWGLNMFFFSSLDSQDRPGEGGPESTRFLVPLKKPAGVTRIVVFGESAAMGEPPDKEYGLWRILDALLRARFPERSFEVIPLACSATDSNAMYLVAKAAVAMAPDLFVMYMGNNEITGSNGVINPIWRLAGGSVAPIRVWKLMLHSNTVRIAADLMRIAELLSFGGFDPSVALARMASFDPKGPEVQACIARFQVNLGDMCRIALEHGAGVVVSTVATNLRDWAPFYSVHGPEWVSASEPEWERLMDEGRRLETEAKYQEAAVVYERALKLDSRYAELHFHLGHCYFRSGNTALANEHYIQARENDGLQARANNGINRSASDVVCELASPRVVLADSAKAVADASPGGVPGWEMFYDQVHMQFTGSYCVARSILDSVAALVDGRPSPVPEALAQACSEDACARRLALTPETRLHHLDGVEQGELNGFRTVLKKDWGVKEAEEQRKRLQQQVEGADPLRLLHAHEEALRLNADDQILQARYLALLIDRNDSDRAYAYANQLASNRPAYKALLLQIARIQSTKGHGDEAVATLERASALYPKDADVLRVLKGTQAPPH